MVARNLRYTAFEPSRTLSVSHFGRTTRNPQPVILSQSKGGTRMQPTTQL
jgi:hypothetical protein